VPGNEHDGDCNAHEEATENLLSPRFNTLRRALTTSGKRLTSRRYKLGRALWDWRQELIEALGGDVRTSPQQITLIDLSVKTKLLLDSIDAWILTRSSPIGAGSSWRDSTRNATW
jgi:hypothetical protein